LNENPDYPLGSNERLEYLGDAIVELIVSDYLYRAFPDAPEGVLSAMRASVVRAQTLAQGGKSLGLDRFLLVSRGEVQTGARAGRKILGQAFEAVVGAIYLDHGLDVTREFVLRVLSAELTGVQNAYPDVDPKSRLQELTQATEALTPAYELVATTGPGHRPHFVVHVRIGEKVLGTGEGDNKQDAEEAAARMALKRLAASAPRPGPS
jgi:ribonuclease-3